MTQTQNPVCRHCGHTYFDHAYGSRSCDHRNHGNDLECGCEEWDPLAKYPKPAATKPVATPKNNQESVMKITAALKLITDAQNKLNAACRELCDVRDLLKYTDNNVRRSYHTLAKLAISVADVGVDLESRIDEGGLP